LFEWKVMKFICHILKKDKNEVMVRMR